MDDDVWPKKRKKAKALKKEIVMAMVPYFRECIRREHEGLRTKKFVDEIIENFGVSRGVFYSLKSRYNKDPNGPRYTGGKRRRIPSNRNRLPKSLLRL